MKLKQFRFGLFSCLILALSLLLAACGDPTTTPAPAGATTAAAGAATTKAGPVNTAQAAGAKFKVAFVYVGPTTDGGWTTAHDEGRKFLEKAMPNVETTFVENVPETSADAEKVITDLALKGNQIIFTTSFGYMDPTINVAKKFPKVYFEHATGYKTADNVSTYQVRQYQPRYLAGIIAGKMTKSNTIGYVAAFPIPEVIGGINAFTLGAQSVNPNVKVKVVWTNTWYDPATEGQAAVSLLNAGADIMAQHQDSPAMLQATEKAGKFGIGNDAPMDSFAPKAYLTSPAWNWGPYYVERVKAAMGGSWKKAEYFGGLKEGVVDLAPISKLVPDDIKALVDTKKKALLSGELDVYVGPLKDQTGAVKIEAGKKASDADILGMDYFVQGVEGTIPKK